MSEIPHPPLEFAAFDESDHRAQFARELVHTLVTFHDAHTPLRVQIGERYAAMPVTNGIVLQGAAVPMAFRLVSEPVLYDSKSLAAPQSAVDMQPLAASESHFVATLEYSVVDDATRFPQDEALHWTPYVTVVADNTSAETGWYVIDKETGADFGDADVFRASLVLDAVRRQYIRQQAGTTLDAVIQHNTENLFATEDSSYPDDDSAEADEIITVTERQGFIDFQAAMFIEPANGSCDACLQTGMGCVHTISARQ